MPQPHPVGKLALKGSVDNFGARKAFDLALRLEMMGKESELNRASGVFSSLAREMERLETALEGLIGKTLSRRRTGL
jgi:hypothetical protein